MKSRFLIFSFFIFMVTRTIVFDTLLMNKTSIKLNQAIGLPSLNLQSRVQFLEEAQQFINLTIENQPFRVDPSVEKDALIQAAEYLETEQKYSNYVPGKQLLSNPEFEYGEIGWIEYSSAWKLQANSMLDKNETILVYSRTGDGHGSLNQLLVLRAGECYLLSVVGAVDRHDEVPTFWLYWETYETGRPVGNSLISSPGNQPWQRRDGVFCLSPSDEPLQKVIVAPVNLYGNATAYLDSARLYELRWKE